MQIEPDFRPFASLASLDSTIENGAGARLRDVEVTPIGERLVFHNRNTGTILLSNSLGGQILNGIKDGGDIGTISHRLARDFDDVGAAELFIRDTVQSWIQAGLFRAPREGPIINLGPTTSATHEACFSVGSRQFRFISESEEVFGDVATLMADYRTPVDPDRAVATISVLLTSGGHTVHLNDSALWRPGSADEARFLVIQTALSLLAGRENVSAVFHAAAVVRNGEALLLAGPSGRGKTTLALLLAENGWQFAGDDLIALDRDGRRIISLPLAAHFKGNNLAEAGDKNAHFAFHVDRSGGYTWPPEPAPEGDLFRVLAMVFPSYKAEGKFCETEVAPEAALQYLLTTGTEIVPSDGSIEPLAGLLNSIPCYNWTYGNNRDALLAANRIFGENRIEEKL